MITKYKTPLGQNRWSGRILELQNEAKRTRTNRSSGILYREGRGGTVYSATHSNNKTTSNNVPRWG